MRVRFCVALFLAAAVAEDCLQTYKNCLPEKWLGKIPVASELASGAALLSFCADHSGQASGIWSCLLTAALRLEMITRDAIPSEEEAGPWCWQKASAAWAPKEKKLFHRVLRADAALCRLHLHHIGRLEGGDACLKRKLSECVSPAEVNRTACLAPCFPEPDIFRGVQDPSELSAGSTNPVITSLGAIILLLTILMLTM